VVGLTLLVVVSADHLEEVVGERDGHESQLRNSFSNSKQPQSNLHWVGFSHALMTASKLITLGKRLNCGIYLSKLKASPFHAHVYACIDSTLVKANSN
jgi:hypothetical protein